MLRSLVPCAPTDLILPLPPSSDRFPDWPIPQDKGINAPTPMSPLFHAAISPYIASASRHPLSSAAVTIITTPSNYYPIARGTCHHPIYPEMTRLGPEPNYSDPQRLLSKAAIIPCGLPIPGFTGYTVVL